MKLVLVDGHQLFTQSLKSLLLKEGLFEEVLTYSSGQHFLSNVNLIKKPDVIITDLLMEGMNGIELQKACLEIFKNAVKIIVLSSITDVQTIKQAIRNGAKGFLSKDTDFDELVEAIKTVNTGGQYIGLSLREKMLDSVFVEEQVVYHLTVKEREVLSGLCQGSTVKEIAFDMSLSPHTIQYYHRSILSKLKLKRTADLIVFAVQNGLYIPKIDKKK